MSTHDIERKRKDADRHDHSKLSKSNFLLFSQLRKENYERLFEI
jgi:hypothetical protein